MIDEWLPSLWRRIHHLCRFTHPFLEKLPTAQRPAPKYSLQIRKLPPADSVHTHPEVASAQQEGEEGEEGEEGAEGEEGEEGEETSAAGTFSLSRPLRARVQENTRITADDWQQEVRLVVLDTCEKGHKKREKKREKKRKHGGGVVYSPGHVACVLPRNPPHTVDAFLGRCSLDGALLIERITETGASFASYTSPHASDPFSLAHVPLPITVRELVRSYLDINGCPRRHFFQMLSYFATEELHRSRLEDFAATDGQEELQRYCYREHRSVLEVLEDFSSATPPLDYLLDMIRPIQPRRFSISSSCLLHPGHLHITALVVRYTTPFGKEREGLCTSWMAKLDPGKDRVRVWIEPASPTFPLGSVPPTEPLILVGPGTGLAAFRAVVQERHALRTLHGQDTGPTMFFFGCRHESKDFHYGEEWRRYREANTLSHLYVAFSRDQPHKVYVQHLIKQHGAQVFALLQAGARVFVSGSALQMPQAVRSAMVEVLQEHGGMDEEAATDRIRAMEKRALYCTETWL
eukprot:TRINITY_DN6011_c2_g1_i1.p1 TRINITY_DN6011_c2_g1~~TRINITY_DN6011_c2_g1_i1.p1  ORF type:complete len:600 (-),score=190.14 TRINITY_DN6011_c2_g1_i1:35-1591(-)